MLWNGEPWKHAKWDKPVTKRQILCHSTCMEIPLVVSVYAILLYTSIIYMDKINSVSYKSIKEEKNKNCMMW